LIEEKKQDVEENAERRIYIFRLILRVMMIASLSEHVSLFNNSHAANNAPVQAWTMRMKEPQLIICVLMLAAGDDGGLGQQGKLPEEQKVVAAADERAKGPTTTPAAPPCRPSPQGLSPGKIYLFTIFLMEEIPKEPIMF